MKSCYLTGCAVALTLSAAVAAQTPSSQTAPASPTTTSSQAGTASATKDESAPVTVEGCLVRERDVPGRKLNPVEQAGVTEDFILMSSKMIKGTAPGATAQARAADSPTGTSGSDVMFDVKGLDDDRLKPMVGRRVQIDGVFADVSRSAGADAAEDLVDIRGTAVRAVAGECPATK